MNSVLHDVKQVTDMILSGKNLVLAGDAKLFADLPRGNWIGGSIPYFMAEEGGVHTVDKLYVTVLPSYVKGATVKHYDLGSVANVYTDMHAHGFSFILIPAFSATHSSFALRASGFKGFASQPLIGWITGVSLSDIGKVHPVVVDGTTGEHYADGAAVMHVELPADKVAQLDILNMFTQGAGDVIEFQEDGFEAKQVIVNGSVQALAAYLENKQIDLKLPLVADYAGALINTSFQAVDAATGTVKFYAPVFRGAQYRVAAAPGDYVAAFNREMTARAGEQLFFSCNCILNYVYAGLEGRKTGSVTGPITFGEIAYQLLNQTMVYLTITDL